MARAATAETLLTSTSEHHVVTCPRHTNRQAVVDPDSAIVQAGLLTPLDTAKLKQNKWSVFTIAAPAAETAASLWDKIWTSLADARNALEVICTREATTPEDDDDAPVCLLAGPELPRLFSVLLHKPGRNIVHLVDIFPPPLQIVDRSWLLCVGLGQLETRRRATKLCEVRQRLGFDRCANFSCSVVAKATVKAVAADSLEMPGLEFEQKVAEAKVQRAGERCGAATIFAKVDRELRIMRRIGKHSYLSEKSNELPKTFVD